MSLKDRILESSWGYSLWSAAFIQPKVDAVRGMLKSAGKRGGAFLDVGCGPGSNSVFFGGDFDYLGVDINPDYIAKATTKFPDMAFAVRDATELSLEGRSFDVVLINSLVHHLDDAQTGVLMTQLREVLRPGGVIILQEPLIPSSRQWFMRVLMRMDRGKYFRDLEHWQGLYQEAGYSIEREEHYFISMLGVRGWSMYSAMLRLKL
jgi:SAM-dependent methyltransferase